MSNLTKLFKKEWRLAIAPSIFVFIYALLGLTLLAPNYPYFVAFGYCLIGIPTLFSFSKGNRDLEFTANLPISRADIVKSKFVTISFIQILQIIVAIPFAILSALLINAKGNIIGLDANLSLFAITFIEFGVFNLIFMPTFFKTGYRLAPATTFAILGYLFTTILFEILIAFIPALNILFDGYSNIVAQICLLAFGVVFYIASMFLSFKLSVKNFNKVNL